MKDITLLKAMQTATQYIVVTIAAVNTSTERQDAYVTLIVIRGCRQFVAVMVSHMATNVL